MQKVRIGIFGLRRGSAYIPHFLSNNADVVAICDRNERWVKEAKDQLDASVTVYSDFEEFIEHPMDAVFLANYFNEHAPYAIKCLERDIHVLSECTSNGTMAEGVALVRAVEKSKAIYMLAENYPYMLFNQEIKKICDGGTLGEFLYAEGEYNHPGNVFGTSWEDLFDSEKHWRNYLPSTYYLTHSLAPIMFATGANPTKVTAFPIYAPVPTDCNRASYVGDNTAIIMTLNDNGSVFKFTGCAALGAHSNSYRVCGRKGQIENIRGGNGKVMLRYNEWNIPEGMEETNYYMPEIVDKDIELAKKAGHDGGDFFIAREFLDCVREKKKHPFDVYFATRMASVAILAHRSVLNGGMPYDVPDFSKKADRIKYENDYATPFWNDDDNALIIPCCSNPDYEPSEIQKQNFRKVLERR